MSLEERSFFRKIADNFAIVFAVGLVLLGLSTYRIYIRENFIISMVLLGTSTFSMLIIFGIWRKFTVRYAPNIIYWTTQQKWLRKAVAGGSFSYYEYKPNVFKIGLFEPISRFISMMIAFIGIASTFAQAFNLKPDPPVASLSSALVWAVLIILVPIILTPIVPIIWSMEDLELKSWNDKWKTNVRVSKKYKTRFNSLIAVGTLGIAFALASDPNLSTFENLEIFLDLLQVALVALVYPIAVLTLLYYIYFRGIVIEKIRHKMSIPIAETRLIYRNLEGQILDSNGIVIAEKPKGEKDTIQALASGRASPTDEQLQDSSSPSVLDKLAFWKKSPDHSSDTPKPSSGIESPTEASDIDTTQTDMNEQDSNEDVVESDDKNLPQKIGSTAKSAVTKTGDAVVGTGKAIVDGVAGVGKSISDNTIGRLFGKKEEPDEKPKRKRGSATAGLWDGDDGDDGDDTSEPEYKHKGGSATAGLWDDKEKDKRKKKKD